MGQTAASACQLRRENSFITGVAVKEIGICQDENA